MREVRWIGLAVLWLSLLGATSARAVSLQPIGAFDQPTYVTSEPDNPDRLYVVERLGTIRLVQGASVGTFADLTSLVGCPSSGCAGERGLMSIAFAPDFSSSGHLYVDYIDNGTGEIHVDELTSTSDVAETSTLRPLLTISHADASNHNGGQLQFGPDGDLYVSTGDGGGGNDQFHNAQDLSSLLGKILRIDPRPSGARPYTVPGGNPFPAAAAPDDTIWSYGLRNPFRFSFDRLGGDLVIGDVGQGAREEVDYAPRSPLGAVGGGGANYGWNCREGLVAGPGDDLPPGQCAAMSFVDPAFDYPHADPGGGAAFGCAIIGGYVVRDRSLGDLYGRYVYADLCVGEIRSLLLPAAAGEPASDDRSEGLTVPSPVSFGEDSCGRVYVVAGGGEVSRLEGGTPASCPEAAPPSPPGPVPAPGPSAAPAASEGLGAAAAAAGRLATSLRVGVARHRVEASARAPIAARVSPCAGRRGQRVRLYRGGRPLAAKRLDDECGARFLPRIAHRSTFRVRVPGTAAYLPARSRRLTIHAAAKTQAG